MFVVINVPVIIINSGDITIPSGMTFTEVSNINGAGPQFILTCISAGGPATTVTWARDSGVLSQSKTLTIATVLDDPVTAQYTHTLAVTGRQDGNYSCAVSNSKPSLARAALYVGGKPLLSMVCNSLSLMITMGSLL